MSHTLGPWKARRLIDDQGKPYSTLYEAHVDIGPCMIWAPVGNKEQEANAHLIAAAPDLLEACEEALKEIRLMREKDGAGPYDPTLIARIKFTIKKARGES